MKISKELNQSSVSKSVDGCGTDVLFLYVTLWDKLWHFIQLKCLFVDVAK